MKVKLKKVKVTNLIKIPNDDQNQKTEMKMI